MSSPSSGSCTSCSAARSSSRDDEVEEVKRVTGPGSAAQRLGCRPGADAEMLQAAALRAVEKWRDRAADPLADRELAEASEILVRSYEGLYAAVPE